MELNNDIRNFELLQVNWSRFNIDAILQYNYIFMNEIGNLLERVPFSKIYHIFLLQSLNLFST